MVTDENGKKANKKLNVIMGFMKELLQGSRYNDKFGFIGIIVGMSFLCVFYGLAVGIGITFIIFYGTFLVVSYNPTFERIKKQTNNKTKSQQPFPKEQKNDNK